MRKLFNITFRGDKTMVVTGMDRDEAVARFVENEQHEHDNVTILQVEEIVEIA